MNYERRLLRASYTTIVASIAVVALLMLPGRAGAANYTMTGSPTDPSITGYSLVYGSTGNPYLPALTTFTDNWSFTVTSASNFQVTSILDWGSSGFTSLSSTLLTGALTPTGYSGAPFGNASASSFLAPGNYVFRVTGTTDSSGWNWYGGQLNLAAPTAPVPEPETYAMMLAGLGLMGFVARRRKQKSYA